jgi:hypothetical protein
MADETAAALARIQDRGKMLRGGFYAASHNPAPDLPFRPVDQPVSGPPVGPGKRNWYVDRIEGDPGHRTAVLLDEAGVPHDEPAKPGMRESFYELGGQPPSEPADMRMRHLMDPNPHSTIDLTQVGDALPKVPLAPGSPGPPIPPPADAFVGQKRAGKKPQKPPAQQ